MSVALRFAFGVTLLATSAAAAAQPRSLANLPPDATMRGVLDEQNRARAAFGLAPFRWDQGLARGASSYAAYLARIGTLVHSPRSSRVGARENLAMGATDARQLVRNWLAEGRYFVPGIYPRISRTGRAEDIVHYTQIIWPSTLSVGCGMVAGRGRNWLVCRYSPGGNRDGRRIP